MGNSQSAGEKETGGGVSGSQLDAKLRRFQTGASDPASVQSTSPTPPLRRTSTTATSSSSEKRNGSLGRSSPSLNSRVPSGSSSLGRKSGVVSATASPRASEREKAWVRSVTGRRSSTMSPEDVTRSPSRGRTRSGSIGLLFNNGQRGPTLHEDEVYDPNTHTATAKRSQVTFRRKKSIELTDVQEPGLTSMIDEVAEPSTPMPLPKKIASDSNFSLASPSSPTGELPRSISMLGNQDSPASGSPAGHTDPADVFNPLFPPTAPKTSNMDPLGRSQPAAFPSYLKIPTLIPSQYASPTTTTPSSPAIPDYQDWSASSTSSQATPQQSTFPTKLGGGGTAAAAILNTEEIVIKPGGASIASTPTERSPETPAEWAEAMDVRGSREGSEEAGSSSIEGGNGEHSRTPTPTPGNVHGAKALTPTGEIPPAMSTLSSALDSSKMEASWASSSSRRGGLKVYTGGESGANTPGLPIGLTMGPSSALIPQKIPAFNADRPDESSAISAAPLTKATNNLSLTTPQASARNKLTPTQSKPHSNATTPTTALSQVPLMPITVKWRGGGKEVFVTGTFANEWRSKILLKRVAGSGKRAEYSCVLHLAPGTHRLKFIVDDRWRVSRDLSTASDGEGNLTNYIEVAHIGPAHPGPLSAPGEDLLLPEDEEEKRKKGSVAPSNLAAHKATLDLIEEARRAEALRRGDLLDVFGNEKVHKEETWTQEIPESIIKAQLAEEAFRAEQEERKADPKHSRRDSAMSASNVPVPPTLPRQLEKVILNSSPAAVAGAVDDTSVLPAPNHAVLHHLTASAIKSGVVATGCTMRYRKKYITTIYYRAAN